ncbi:MAG: NUDIX domain-containing protein [Granulosicoccus sp.]
MSEPEIKRIDTKVVYKNRWMTVREDRVRRPNGDHGLFGVVDKPDFSLIIPFDGEKFHLVQQYRYPVNGRFWEFPQGSLELNPDSTPEQVASVELKEETGLRANSMIKLGKFFQAYGYASQAVHIFLATGLEEGESALDAEEQGLVSGQFTRAECDAMLVDGQLSDLSTVAAMHMFDKYTKSKEIES